MISPDGKVHFANCPCSFCEARREGKPDPILGSVAALVVRVSAQIAEFEKNITAFERKWGRSGGKLQSILSSLTKRYQKKIPRRKST